MPDIFRSQEGVTLGQSLCGAVPGAWGMSILMERVRSWHGQVIVIRFMARALRFQTLGRLKNSAFIQMQLVA